MKKLLFTLPMLILFLPLLFNVAFRSDSMITSNESLGENHLIAHALGGVNGKPYSNSLEAFIENYDNGIRIFEVDLSITSDGYVVCRHDWNTSLYSFLEQEVLNENDEAITIEEFYSQPIFNTYTNLSFEELLNILLEYDDAYLVLDTKSTDEAGIRKEYSLLTEVIKSVDINLFKRIIPQIYNRDMLSTIKEYHDFPIVFYTLYQDPINDEELLSFAIDNKINGIIMGIPRYSQTLIDNLNKHNILSYVHTINEPEDLIFYTENGATGVYTDFLQPSILDSNIN